MAIIQAHKKNQANLAQVLQGKDTMHRTHKAWSEFSAAWNRTFGRVQYNFLSCPKMPRSRARPQVNPRGRHFMIGVFTYGIDT